MSARRPTAVARLAAVVLAGAALAGCAAPDTRVLHLGVDEAPEGRRMLWPAPPEVPRYLYAGQLTGEANFRRAGEPAKSALRGLLEWVAGLASETSRPVTLQRPQSGTVDARGRILVSDVSRQAIFVFEDGADGPQLWERADGVRRFVAPVGVGTGADGTVFVADAQLALVARLDARGEPLAPIGTGILRRPSGLAADPANKRLFVADTHAHDVKVFAEDGRLLSVIGRRGEAPGEFNFPTHVAYVDGELYVTDTMNHRVQVLDPGSGRALRTIGERGLYVGNLVRPKGIAVDSEKNVYVIESYYDHLLVFDRKGRFLMGFGGAGAGTGRFYLPSGVWTDRLNRVFVADTFNGRIAVYQFLGGGADGEL